MAEARRREEQIEVPDGQGCRRSLPRHTQADRRSLRRAAGRALADGSHRAAPIPFSGSNLTATIRSRFVSNGRCADEDGPGP